MIPLRHNFLSPQKRHFLHHMVQFQFVKTILEILLISLCLGGMILLGGQRILQDYFNDLTQQIVAISNKNSSTNQEIKKINLILNKTEKIQQEYILWTKKFINLANNTPRPITLTQLNFNPPEKTITFSGNAPTRDDLLKFKEQISQLEWIESMEIPLSQLTAKENIFFSLNAKIK